VGLLGVLPPSSTVVSQNPASLQPNGFYRGSGTSEATAVVSGLAALAVADFPGVTTDQVKASLRTSANPMFARGTGAGIANVVNRLARSRDDWRMGDGGALGEATFDSSEWGVNGWGAALWGTTDWNSTATWGTSKWMSDAWAALAYTDGVDWATSKWMTSKWMTSKWMTSKWMTSKWMTSTWGTSTWGSDSWGQGGDAS
jgi:serine protease AprX